MRSVLALPSVPALLGVMLCSAFSVAQSPTSSSSRSSNTSAQSATPSAQPSTATAAVDLETIGPKVGEPLPDFTLPDQRGQPRALKSLIGANGAVVVFFRSADW